MLVIFDCDGVLVDSESLASEVFASVLQNNGFNFSASQCLSLFKGRTLTDCFELIESLEARSLPVGFLAQLDELTKYVFSERLQPVEGVECVLEFLQKRTRSFCVASNGGIKKTLNSLSTTALEGYFPESLRFSAEQVARGKPAPDLFLYAAEQVGVPARFCWVVEDSQAGAEAAIAAQMRLIFYTAGQPVPDAVMALEPDRICNSMAELLSFFKASIVC